MECRTQLAQHVIEGPCDWMYNVKWECAEKGAALYATCITALVFARRRLKVAATWIEEH